MANKNPETVDQFLARGGKVDYLPPTPPPRATQVSLQEVEKIGKTGKPARKIGTLKGLNNYRNLETPHL